MTANPLKALLIIGVDQPPLSDEITKLYNREDCLIIGDGTRDISIEDIKKELKEKNFVLDNTRIDITAHGIQDNKQHFIWLKGKELTKTKNFFADLSEIGDKPLNVQLWACHGSAANKDVEFLNNGSTLITHIESKYSSWNELADFALKKSLQRYFDKKGLTPEEQFISGFPENFETMTFSKVDHNNITKYKTTRFLKDDKIADLVEVLKDSSDLKSIVNNDIKLNKKLFCENLPKDVAEKVEKIATNLNNEQIQDYIAGRLIHAIGKDITKENEEATIEVIDLLKNKGGLDLNHRINEIPLLHYSTENSKILKQLIKNIHDVNIIDHKGDTALHWAVLNKNNESVKELLSHPNIDVSKKDHEGKTPLDLAIENDNKEIVKTFLENKKFNILNVDPSNRKQALNIALEHGFNIKPEIASKPVLASNKPEPKPRTTIRPVAKPRTVFVSETPTPPVAKPRTVFVSETPTPPVAKPRTVFAAETPIIPLKPSIPPKPVLTSNNIQPKPKPSDKSTAPVKPPIPPKPIIPPKPLIPNSTPPIPKPRNPQGRG